MTLWELSWKWMSFLSFGFSVIAAVLAIDMYKLSRTGQFGASWRVLITATVVYALLQASHLAEMVNINFARMSQVVELFFVLALAYSFYLQRQLFRRASDFRHDHERRERSNYSGAERRRRRNEPYHGPERRLHPDAATDDSPLVEQRRAQDESHDNKPNAGEKTEEDWDEDDAQSDIEWHSVDSVAR